MKYSIDKIFKNLVKMQIILFILAFLAAAFIFTQYSFYKKVDILNHQKETVANLFAQQEISNSFDVIQLNSKVAQFKDEIDNLINQHNNSFLDKFLMDKTNTYDADLRKLNSLIEKYNNQSKRYFNLSKNSQKNMQILNDLKKTKESISTVANKMVVFLISYEKTRLNLLIKYHLFLLIFIILTILLYKKRLKGINDDIMILVNNTNSNSPFYTLEADAITQRIKRNKVTPKNPEHIDSTTGINNNKGLLKDYSEKKKLKEHNMQAVAVIEIDNFSKSNRAFSQGFTKTILKKVAYLSSLHQKSSDVIARTDYNQFTLVFSRSTKDQLFKDVDNLRESISEVTLMSPEEQKVNITVTGGFIVKARNLSLEDCIRKAKELLEKSIDKGSNKIYQEVDFPV